MKRLDLWFCYALQNLHGKDCPVVAPHLTWGTDKLFLAKLSLILLVDDLVLQKDDFVVKSSLFVRDYGMDGTRRRSIAG